MPIGPVGRGSVPEEITDIPENPVLDRPGGWANIPYRGTEQHGVAIEHKEYPTSPDRYPEEQVGDVTYIEDTERDQHPIPVRIVTEASREIKSWRTWRTNVDTSVRLIVGRNNNNTRVRIRNMDTTATNICYVSNDMGVTALTGWPIAINETLEIVTENEVYAIAPGPIYIQVILETAVVIVD